jgi:hypothetical protein
MRLMMVGTAEGVGRSRLRWAIGFRAFSEDHRGWASHFQGGPPTGCGGAQPLLVIVDGQVMASCACIGLEREKAVWRPP